MASFANGISISSRATSRDIDTLRRALRTRQEQTRANAEPFNIPADRDTSQVRFLARHHSAPAFRGATFVLRGGVR